LGNAVKLDRHDSSAKKAAKKFRVISKKTLELFETYDCPGNDSVALTPPNLLTVRLLPKNQHDSSL
jgi:hypothetical protein